MSLNFGYTRSASRSAGTACAFLCCLLACVASAAAQQPAPSQAPDPSPGASPQTPAQQAVPDNSPAAQSATAPPVQTVPPSSAPPQAVTPAQTETTPGQADPDRGTTAKIGAAQAGAADPGAVNAGQRHVTEASAAPAPVTEEELKQQLVGKQFYLRGGYLADTLAFDEHGKITGHPTQGSYSLSVLQIDHVRLTKHKLDLEATRFGLHFNEQLAYEDASSAYDKVRITPKKKIVRISIDREMVVNPKKKKEQAASKSGPDKGKKGGAQLASASAAKPVVPATAVSADTAAASAASPAAPAAAEPAANTPAQTGGEPSEADQLKASIAATPAAERPADPNSVTTTTSQSHANGLLRAALDTVLSSGLDDRMMTAMPDFWKLYYRSVAAKADYRPADSTILRQNTVDQKAHLLTSFEPASNDFAQTAGVAGMALYHTVIGSDGTPGEIAVGRPIGFGLDENAVAAIRKARFSPAIKNGQPVPVMLDLVVQFRIFSGRTGAPNPGPASVPAPAPVSAPASTETAEKEKPAAPSLPGPYSVAHQ